ncbi:MAG: hypothetical protein J7518_07865 [Nocardioidaceae bacterium]|nr:hypothetical protein [Nocardioidaceae bacterium]
MDLSGLIFVVLAVGWAVVLIPMALKRHDDDAMTRPVETFSDAVRVLGRGTAASAPATPAPAPVEEAPRVHTVTRESARRAARRRRRVLAVLLLALVAVSVTSYLGYTPWLSTAAPGGLIVAFLVVARLTVRAQQVRRAAPVQHAPASAPAAPVAEDAEAAEVEPDLGREDTVGVSREELAAAVAAPALDEGSLWDPLPVTLPTYVNKARARRTVRTVEITGMTSSGHDAADSALAREAEAAEAEARDAEQTAEDRKAAGA